jgi:hypothetical protein
VTAAPNSARSACPTLEPSDYAAVPPNAFGCVFLPDRIQKGYHVEELADGAYYVSNGAYDAMFISTCSGVIVVNLGSDDPTPDTTKTWDERSGIPPECVSLQARRPPAPGRSFP